MPLTHTRLSLIASTPDALGVIYVAFRQCYHAGFAGDMWVDMQNGKVDREKQAHFVEKILESGHMSPLEHASFTFAVEGVSRALTHQLVRHRLASYSQQSQRYVDASHFEYVIPPAIAANSAARERFETFMEETGEVYRELKALLEQDGRKGSQSNEDARFVLPQATASKIVLTMNCRELLHFFEQRCCMRAQWEIRNIADEMLRICKDVLPEIFQRAGASCERLGYCPEGEKFCCGRYPLRNEASAS